MIDWESVIVNLITLGIFGVIYAYIGGKVGFRAGVNAAKGMLFDFFGIDPKKWKNQTAEEKRKAMIKTLAGAIQETINEVKADEQVKKMTTAAIAELKAMPEFKEAMKVLNNLKTLAANVTEEIDAETKKQQEKRKKADDHG
jgi:nitrogen regulatory protein PII-like uncharacterized protein